MTVAINAVAVHQGAGEMKEIPTYRSVLLIVAVCVETLGCFRQQVLLRRYKPLTYLLPPPSYPDQRRDKRDKSRYGRESVAEDEPL